MSYQTIITPATLADNLNKPNWLILDCRKLLLSNSQGYNTFMFQHIPNAYYCSADIDSLMSKFYNSSSLESERIVSDLISIGFNLDTQIILYEDLNSSLTNSLWLKLRSLGIPNVAVLEGGFTSWKDQNFPTTMIKQLHKNQNQMSPFH